MSATSRRALERLRPLLVAAVAVSIVHYADNVVNYADYPDPTSGPDPSREVIAAAWFVFTAFGIAAYLLVARERFHAAGVCLAVYAGSGLVGIGHYNVPGAGDMPWWRHAHIIADILLGFVLLTFALWLVRRDRTPGGAAPRRS